MKHATNILLLCLASLVVSVSSGRGDEAAVPEAESGSALALATSNGILPGFKRGIRVGIEERNPYSDRVVEKKAIVDAESEAAKIIRILEGLSVRGISRGRDGKIKRVLFGDIPLIEGGDLPQILPGQTDEVFVSRIGEEELELTWRAESGEKLEDGRRILIKIDHQPRIEVVLPGQVDLEPGARERAYLVALPMLQNREERGLAASSSEEP